MSPTAPGTVVVMTRRADLAARLDRLAASLGLTVEVVEGSASAVIPSPVAMMVDADLRTAIEPRDLPPGQRVLVVTTEPPDLPVSAWAMDCGASAVIRLPDGDRDVLARLAACVDERQPRGQVVAVAGGCGGLGTSTLAGALASVAASSGPTTLIDVDPTGGGLDVLLGHDGAGGLSWSDVAAATGRLPAQALLSKLTSIQGVAFLGFGREPDDPPTAAVVERVVDACARGSRTVVVDLGRGDLSPGAAVLRSAAVGYLVVGSTVHAAAAARRTWERLRHHSTGMRLVVRRQPGPALRAEQVGTFLGLTVAATLPDDPQVARAAMDGRPPVGGRGRGDLGAVARHLLAACHDEPRAA